MCEKTFCPKPKSLDWINPVYCKMKMLAWIIYSATCQLSIECEQNRIAADIWMIFRYQWSIRIPGDLLLIVKYVVVCAGHICCPLSLGWYAAGMAASLLHLQYRDTTTPAIVSLSPPSPALIRQHTDTPGHSSDTRWWSESVWIDNVCWML